MLLILKHNEFNIIKIYHYAFFDFHYHPGLKPRFSDPATKVTGLQQLKKDMHSDIAKNLTKILGNTNAIDADELLDNIFYNNGKNFMLKRLKEMNG